MSSTRQSFCNKLITPIICALICSLSHSASGKTHWGSFKDNGCVIDSNNKKRRSYSAVLHGIPYGQSWEDACENKSAVVHGLHYDRPNACVKGSLDQVSATVIGLSLTALYVAFPPTAVFGPLSGSIASFATAQGISFLGATSMWGIFYANDGTCGQTYKIRTKEWDNKYMYMQSEETGNIRGWNGDPGPQGHWKMSRIGDSYFLRPKQFIPAWFLYMQDNGHGNVRGWGGHPGPQGELVFNQNDDGSSFKISTKQWPNWYIYMQDNAEGNIRGWEGDPGPQGHWMIEEI